MAGFQAFASPRYIRTTAYFFYVDKKVSRKNLLLVIASHGLISLALARYFLLRAVLDNYSIDFKWWCLHLSIS